MTMVGKRGLRGRRRRVERLLGPLEAACMRALWRRSPATVAEVRDRINARHDPPLAYTTVMTVLSRLHEKGHVTRQREGRGYAYTPAFSEDELVDVLSRREVDQLIERYGDVALARFAETLRQVDPELLHEATRMARERDDG
jgi:predicted transcriptional regulator